jgi:hypothetical protein
MLGLESGPSVRVGSGPLVGDARCNCCCSSSGSEPSTHPTPKESALSGGEGGIVTGGRTDTATAPGCAVGGGAGGGAGAAGREGGGATGGGGNGRVAVVYCIIGTSPGPGYGAWYPGTPGYGPATYIWPLGFQPAPDGYGCGAAGRPGGKGGLTCMPGKWCCCCSCSCCCGCCTCGCHCEGCAWNCSAGAPGASPFGMLIIPRTRPVAVSIRRGIGAPRVLTRLVPGGSDIIIEPSVFA